MQPAAIHSASETPSAWARLRARWPGWLAASSSLRWRSAAARVAKVGSVIAFSRVWFWRGGPAAAARRVQYW
ncbi:hypothetical protein L524_4734 [Bordetella bronchiseptica MBORD762]|nr:hypothetical protein L524_4734 [Bordetella bronchiseptica MBORD762]